jgi:hypothetical protein
MMNMKRRIVLVGVIGCIGCLALADDPKTDSFKFTDDRGGKLLAQILPPSALPGRERCEQQVTRGPAGIERPTLPSPTFSMTVPRLPVNPSKREQQPGPVAEEVPLSQYRSTPQVPKIPTFFTADKVRVSSADVNQPVPLPILARPVIDRASLEDASQEASHVASLAATMPVRSLAAPYLRFTLPNPFEFRDAVQSKTTLDEDPMPISSTPRLPR